MKPKNTFGLQAGIDLSRRFARALHVRGSAIVSSRFVDAADVTSRARSPRDHSLLSHTELATLELP